MPCAGYTCRGAKAYDGVLRMKEAYSLAAIDCHGVCCQFRVLEGKLENTGRSQCQVFRSNQGQIDAAWQGAAKASRVGRSTVARINQGRAAIDLDRFLKQGNAGRHVLRIYVGYDRAQHYHKFTAACCREFACPNNSPNGHIIIKTHHFKYCWSRVE